MGKNGVISAAQAPRALTQVHHGNRLSDSREDGEALSSVHSTALAAGKLIHNRSLCEMAV